MDVVSYNNFEFFSADGAGHKTKAFPKITSLNFSQFCKFERDKEK
jgi:hypothetical protein